MILPNGTKVEILVGYHKGMKGKVFAYDSENQLYRVNFGILQGGERPRRWSIEELEVIA